VENDEKLSRRLMPFRYADVPAIVSRRSADIVLASCGLRWQLEWAFRHLPDEAMRRAVSGE
jgi:hypothetical protein